MNTDDKAGWLVIGISGVTCGGKTSLANKLLDTIAPVYVFHQDKYFYPDDSPKHVKVQGLAHNNYDVLSALDMDGMQEDVAQTMRGVDKSHASNVLREGKFTVEGRQFIVMEGFTVLNYEPLVAFCDLRYYFVLEYGECLSRRSLRLYDPPDIDGYFDQCVWPEHLRYRAQVEKDSRIKLLDGTQPNALETVMADLRATTS